MKRIAEAIDHEKAAASFAKVVKALRGNDIEVPNPTRRAFGSNALKVNRKIFAMLVRGELVVKLPKERVLAMVDGANGRFFDAGKGRPMKEWIVVGGDDAKTWVLLSKEACAYVRASK